MTDLEKSRIRQKISKIFVEYGRVKGFLELQGKNIGTPESIFLSNSSDEKNSLIFEIDGLNQVWNNTEIIRDKIEEVINIDNSDFESCNSNIDPFCNEMYEVLDKIEKSIKAKTRT